MPALAQDAAPDGQLAALLDPARNLKQAERLLGEGKRDEARSRLQVALELAPVSSSTWAAALLRGMREFPELAAEILSRGEGAEVPLALMPVPIEAGGTELFPIPASYRRLDFLQEKERRLLAHLTGTGQEVEASRLLERKLEETPGNPQMILYLAALYERMGERVLATKRYQEALDLVTLERDRFAILYSLFRLLYRDGQFVEAQAYLKPFLNLARSQVTQFVERVRTSPNGRENLLEQLLASRRHLVEGLNLQAILRMRKDDSRNAQLLFRQALLLNPGRLSLELNHVLTLGLGGHNATATATLTRISQVLSTVARELQRLTDRSLGGGLSLAGDTYKRGLDAVNRWLATVVTRQGIFLYDLRRLTDAEKSLTEAISYDPKAALAFYYLGLLKLEDEQLSEASVNFRKALTFSSDRAELNRLAKEKVDFILEAQTSKLLEARTPEERLRERVRGEVDVERFRPLDEQLETGRQLLAAGKLEEAGNLLKKLSRDFPESPDPVYLEGLVREQRNDVAGAQRLYERALKIAPDHVPSLSRLAFLLSELGHDAREALTLAERARDLAPLDPDVLSNLGWVRFYAGDSRRSIEALEKAIELAPREPEHHLRLGLVFYRIGLYHFAYSRFQDLLAVAPAHPRGTVFAGLSLAKLGKAREALDTLASALPSYPPPSELNKVLVSTIASLRGGLVARGEEVGPDPGDGRAGASASAAASGEATGSGRPPTAPPIVDEVVTHRIKAPAISEAEARQLAGAARSLEGAIELLQAGRRDEARRALERSVEKDAGNPELAYHLALLLLEDGELDQARSHLDAILDRNPLDLRAYHSLGDIYFRQGRLVPYKDILDRTAPLRGARSYTPLLDELVERWRRALRTGGDSPLAHERIGLIRFHQYRFDQALEELKPIADRPLAAMLLAQIHLHEYHRTLDELEFQTARSLLSKTGFGFIDGVDRLWTLIKSPRLVEVTEAIERELATRKRVELSPEEFSPLTIAGAASGLVGDIDVIGKGIVDARRWDQITEKIEKTRVARTTYEELQEPVLEAIELDPGRRFRQPGGPGVKAGPLPDSAIGAAAGLVGAPVAPTTPTASAGAASPATAPELPALPDGLDDLGDLEELDDASLPLAISLPAIPPGRRLAERKVGNGLELVSRGRLIEARDAFSTALALDGGLETAHSALALTHLALDDAESARTALGRADERFPPEKVRSQASALLAISAGDAGRALEIWKQAPDRALTNLGFITESRRIWERVLAGAPGEPDALYNLSLLAYLERNLDAALSLIGQLPGRTRRAGLLHAAVLLQSGLAGADRAAYGQGLSVLRVTPGEAAKRALPILEARGP